MAVTLKQVADRAGVSIKTVSRVINQQGEISEATRERVMQIVEELDYRPNILARGLVSGRSSTVALIIPQISDPFFPDVMLGVEAVARMHGYNVFLCNTNDDAVEELDQVRALADKRVDGIILCGSRLTADQLTEVARHHRVSILSSREPVGSSVISIPGQEGFFVTTSHLIGLGHQTIGHLGGGALDKRVRFAGYKQAMSQNGLAIERRWIAQMRKVSIEAAYLATKELLARAPELTALTCYNDLAAIGALQACAELGRRVPDDLALVGFDDITLASLVTPKLTTMHVPRFELGQQVMELLLKAIKTNGQHVERRNVSTRLVIRESCGAVAAQKENERSDQSSGQTSSDKSTQKEEPNE